MKKCQIELSDTAKRQLEDLTPAERVEIYRVLEAISLDPVGMGEPLTPDNCPHFPELIEEGKPGFCLCGAKVGEA